LLFEFEIFNQIPFEVMRGREGREREVARGM
jgi:hypothetical protein